MKDDLYEMGVTTSFLPCSTHQTAAAAWPPAVATGLSATGGMLIFYGEKAGWVFEAAKKLEALGRLQPGWDSYNGLSLRPEARELTLQVLDLLGMHNLPVPAVVLGSGGTVHLDWRTKGRELEVELERGNSLNYVKVTPQGDIQEGTATVKGPENLGGLSHWLLHG
jgi:hypothetical protein